MSDGARGSAGSETPVNPYSLLEAVNSASDTAHTSWLIFLAIMAYLTIAIAGVTHKDLLLETPVALPIMQVSIQQALFFEFAPVILVLFHLGIISQLVLLARKTLEFDHAVQSLELTEHRNHPLRLELHNFFFTQAVAGPRRSVIMSAFLHAMSWLTLIVLPVLILLFVQVSYLPFHSPMTTWLHRICLVVDVVMLLLIGIFLMRAETSFFTALWRASLTNPFSFLFTTALMTVVTLFSFFVATVPGEPLDRMTGALIGLDHRDDASESSGGPGRFERASGLLLLRGDAAGSVLARFSRNLSVTDADLVQDKDDKPDDVSVILRGRDLRFARLDRTDLHRSDLTGANLEGASLVGTDLRRARLQCADITDFILSESRTKARCVNARGANLTRAKLAQARMAGIDLNGAQLSEANLEEADLSYATAVGADFSSAQMEKVDLTGGVQLQGANLLITSLRGADMFGVHLEGADLSSAVLQAAILTQANLSGANLRDADLEAADMQSVVLLRANMAGAKVRAADLRGAAVWLTTPPARDQIALADFSGVALKPAEGEDAISVQKASARIDDGTTRARVEEQLAAVLDPAQSTPWATSQDLQAWRSLVTITASTAAESYPKDLTEFLTVMMCKPRYANAAIATGIARRAQGEQFRGNIAAVYDRLKSKDCSGGEAISPALMQSLSAALDTASSK